LGENAQSIKNWTSPDKVFQPRQYRSKTGNPVKRARLTVNVRLHEQGGTKKQAATKYWPIFKIFSPAHYVENLQESG